MSVAGLHEIEGAAFREGRHGGTLVGERWLELVPGVSRGSYHVSFALDRPCDRFVLSLNPEPFPVGAGIRASLGVEGQWAPCGVIGSGRDLPRSESGEGGGWRVDVDVLERAEPVTSVELRLEVEAGEMGGTPRLRRLALLAWSAADAPPTPEQGQPPSPSPAWGQSVEAPAWSQRELSPELAPRACSPTSLAMALASLGHAADPAAVAARVFDQGAKLYGNWSFNVAYAAELGLSATLVRAGDQGLAFLEAEIAAGRPVVISHRYAEGALSGHPASLASTSGHLILIVGFDAEGNPIVHDPAADPREGESVRRVYDRRELATTWANAGQVAYRLVPDDRS